MNPCTPLVLVASALVFVAPVYWYSLPAPLKLDLDHWSAWMRIPGLDFKARLAGKSLALISTTGERLALLDTRPAA